MRPAVGSEKATVEHKDDMLLSGEIGESHRSAFCVGGGEINGCFCCFRIYLLIIPCPVI
jgi:hypothetical protein